MHYLLGLAALVMGAVIATRRTRPTWFVATTTVLVALGALLAILSYLRVTDSLGLLTNSIIGWIFVGLSIITMLASIFVLERRGPRGEELPPLIGDNPFDGDTDDSDDPAVGTSTREGVAASAAAPSSQPRSQGGSAGAAAAPSSLGGIGGVAAPTTQDGVAGSEADSIPDAPASAPIPVPAPGAIATEAPLAASPHPRAADAGQHAHSAGAHAGDTPTTGRDDAAPSLTEDSMTDSTTPNAAHGDADAEARADGTAGSHPGPSSGATDGTAVVGADPDIATSPAETDVDAAPEGDVGAHDPDGTARA